MIRIYPADSRFRTELGWLTGRASFSFADHYDPDNTGFGPLRVFNHDRIAGNRGFGAHPHREMEIVSVVLSGELKHEDSTGRVAVTGFGGVQRMSAGTGIIHSEVNPGEADCELLQIWIEPARGGLEPSYETSSFDPRAMDGRLLPIVSPAGGAGVAAIHQDTTLYLSRLDAGATIAYRQEQGRRIYLFVIEGALAAVGGGDMRELRKNDAARITELHELELCAGGDGAFLILIDLP